MHYQYKKLKHRITRYICFIVISWIILFWLTDKGIFNSYLHMAKSVFLPITGFFASYIIFLYGKQAETANAINNVKPIWKFLAFPFKIKYYPLNTTNTVVDNTRYFFIVLKDKTTIQSINKLKNNTTQKNISFSDNGIANSQDSFFDIKSKTDQLERASCAKNELVVIKSTTIYNDDTYFFQDHYSSLSVGVTIVPRSIFTNFLGLKISPYSGNLTGKQRKFILKTIRNLEQFEEKHNFL